MSDIKHRRKSSRTSHPSAVTSSKRHQPEYEFCGPIGTLVLITFLPTLIYALLFLCNDVSGCPAPGLLSPSTLSWSKLQRQIPWPENGLAGLFDLKAIALTSAYYFFSLLLHFLLPGEEHEGMLLACNARHTYKFNAFSSAIVTLGLLALGTIFYGGASFPIWMYIYGHLPQILTANMLICTTTALFCYLRSFNIPGPGQINPEHRELAPGGCTGNMIYDFFIGRELNPRITIPTWVPHVLGGGQVIDIKVYNEMRPGLLGWLILDLTFIAAQYRNAGTITDSIVLITLFQGIYIIDALYMEPAILSTMDIVMDGFGFMLSFGDLVWVPFLYSLQARYLSVHPVHLGLTGTLGVLSVQALGYWVFRSSNNEKSRFRKDPNDPRIAHLTSMETKSGSRLITSGWWGTARHINYLGDWIMSFSYCLPTGLAGYKIVHHINPVTGTDHPEVTQDSMRGWGMLFTYLYIVYFGVLLVHREMRDEEKCRKKYGADWDRYCEK
ncbi:erg24, C-14 sterol reductase, partial [Elasticomyces elasticus]